jgi:hypothetical protein
MISCASTSWCMAVGHTGGDNFAERSNGSAWSVVPTPNRREGRLYNELTAVSCASPMFCKALGSNQDLGYNDAGQYIGSWNGKSWSLADAPRPERLVAVSCPAANACVAVGGGGIILSYR